MFASLKEKFQEKLEAFKEATTTQDALDKYAADLVEKATSGTLIAPDWGANMEVVDFINNDTALHADKVLRALKKGIVKQNLKIQELSLTLLETCVKNCVPELHVHLAASEVWAEMLKLAADTSITRVDAEIRDKILGMVEDYARVLQPQAFQSAYENLLDQGVDFPVRSPEEAAPILTPPRAHDTVAPTDVAPGLAAAVAAPAALAAGADGAAAAAQDPLAGVSEEDRAAIQAAMAELEAEDIAAREAARVAADADAAAAAAERHARQAEEMHEQQEALAAAAAAAVSADALALQQAGEAGQGAPLPHAAPAATPAAAAAAQPAPQQQEEEEQGPEQITAFIETISNSTLVLSEALANVPDSDPVAVREPFVTELADQCIHMRSRLERQLASLSDEALMASALSQHDELSKVLVRYEELLAAAESVSPTVVQPRAHRSHSAAVGDAASQQQLPAAPGSAPANATSQTAAQLQQTAAAMATAFKSKLSGAFDKIKEAVRSPGAGGQPAPAGAAAAGVPPAGAAAATGMAVGSGAAVATAAAAGGGNFTLDEDEEATEETALITKRGAAQAAGGVAGAPHDAALPPAPPSAAVGPDLINLMDDEPPMPAPAAAAAPAESSLPPPPLPALDSMPLPATLSEDTTATDNLVAALDHLVSQSSLTSPPGSMAAAAGQGDEGGHGGQTHQ